MKKSIKQKRFRQEVTGKILFSILAVLFCLLQSNEVFSQSAEKIQVRGVVSDETGETLIGASVAEKGTSNATITGLDGDYTLTVSPDAVLVVAYIGYSPQEVPVGGKTSVNIQLRSDSQALDEVVVTALGIKRDRKSLGYALSEVKGDQLTENRDANIANSLSGKVAGLQVKPSASGAGGSSRIVLRGANSISGNNQPLIVVDGVPIDGGTGADNDDIWGEGVYDTGSGMSDISPDDIENITVLKGPAAAALYGSRAGNGVIMITTKTGKGTSGIGVSYNSNLTFESLMMTPNFQNTYGQGANGALDQQSIFSWGAEMKGQSYTDYAGSFNDNKEFVSLRNKTYSAGGMDIKDFVRTGTTWTNSLDISSGGDKNTIRFGVMNLMNKGVVPNNDFKRSSATLRATAELTKKLTLDAKANFIHQDMNNMVKLGASPDNIFYQFLLMPRSTHLSDFSLGANGYKSSYKGIVNPYAYPSGTVDASGFDLSGKPLSYAKPSAGNVANPYFSVYNNTTNDRRYRFIGMTSLKYEFTDWLNIQGRYGVDYIASQLKDIQSSGSPLWYSDKNGNFSLSKSDSYEMNADLLITFNKQLTDKLGLLATAGGNMMYSRSDGVWNSTNGLAIEYYYALANGVNKDASNSLYRKQINSLYGTTSFSWDNMLYLDLTARNDWSSALNSDNRSYFYPSAGLSWIFTQSFGERNGLGPINYGKVRMSWAQVGNDTDAYRLHNYRTIRVNSQDGSMQANKNQVKALYNLKNETINSWELGLDLKAFNNRVGLDFAFYNKEAKDQILRKDIPASTGYLFEYINAGNVRNRGIEIMLTGTPVRTKDFVWDVALNWSKNSNKILKLTPDGQRQTLSHASYSDQIIVVADEGGSYGDMYGKAYAKDTKGNLIVDENGLPTYTSSFVKLGNYNPSWMGGLTSTFNYKGISLSFQIDMRYGGDVYMGSYRSGASYGTLDFTEANRAEGSILVKGVYADGTANTTKTNAQLYWGRVANITEEWIYDATNIRLRELSIGYSIPRKLLRQTPLEGVKLSFVGRNLWMIYSKTDGFDPEAGFTTGNAQGIEMGSMPTLRSLGFNLNVTF
ncbi:SusC/RagA family TonB-linked outer membrane protein [Dysgonomonas macrotermitis]|uniref:TonB-linked outer membrane protein, SusC/RagA family n=1 Tax=Dysgonomonas macrotermitis TaxID=1346286 RepID=A0A1M5FCP3_9BACT|nr:SusC/RagA family TonB-linked outer membrane protein [Dysgonomonas macrotermitis]SHF88872.1 TonB-linked outer membrane protein, SusC/RagA family [Dysgonomonas macrotermitis]